MFRQPLILTMFVMLSPAALTLQAVAAERPELPVEWREQWNAEIGLWTRPGAGHTAPVAAAKHVHPGTTAAAQLVAAAVVDRLDEVDAGAVLHALRRMQVTDGGSRHGCLKWYWEEPRPVDTNAAFFTGLNLIVLRLGFPDQVQRLDADAQGTLEAILRDLSVWFDQTLSHPSRHYPNKYMGDLVCRWLLIEALGQQPQRNRVAAEMLESSRYWRDENWGWGEHMSNIYATVLLDQISVLLMLSRELPVEVRREYTELRDGLLAIEDAYGEGPRAPMIRSYNFDRSPSHANYRDRVRRPENPSDLATGNLAMQPVLATLGWSGTVPPRLPPLQDIIVPCYDGVVAVAHVDGPVRLGTLSRFPLMPQMEHPTWGLSWQTFPVTLWHEQGGWGFLQWCTEMDGQNRAHPAERRAEAYLRNALTFDKPKPIVGRTWSIQEGGHAIVLRIMPELYESWDGLIDRFRLVEPNAELSESETNGPWTQIVLNFGDHAVSVHHISLDGHQPRMIQPDGGPWDWQIVYDAADLAVRKRVANLWAFSLAGRIENAPRLERTEGEESWELTWNLGTDRPTWSLRINPTDDQPLCQR
ncbi:MAG: hypothetical protein KJ000_10235 [Pirellulaceae bacterium]|nr:hypothetical protein [Pirellulaceae bacterium]